jgi:heptaprenyl diphosphate synthase
MGLDRVAVVDTSTDRALVERHDRSAGATTAPITLATCWITVETTVVTESVDLTDRCAGFVAESGVAEGFLHLFCTHTTCGLLLNEDEAGLWEDLAGVLERLAPRGAYWAHDDLSRRWQNLDDEPRPNGFSHVRASLTGQPSLSIPIVGGRLGLGRWQRVLLLEFDGGRTRTVTAHAWGLAAPADAPPSRGTHVVHRGRTATRPVRRSSGSRPVAALQSELRRCVGVEAIERDLVRVERALAAAAQTGSPTFTQATSHLVAVSSKRLRPLLTLACAYAGRDLQAPPAASSDRVITASAAVELLHLGSLYHDDVIDDSDVRRGVPTVNANWSNTVAVLAGDFLLARASQTASSLGAEEAVLVATTLATLCEGQALETERLFDVDRDEHAYEEAIARKTASLIAASCRIGALEAELDPSVVEALWTFGHNLGMGFQIVDDILDLTGSDELMGKPRCQDLIEGVYTLPVIHAVRESKELRRLLGRPVGKDAVERARSLVVAGSGIDKARTSAESYTQKAGEALHAQRASLDQEIVIGLDRLSRLLLQRSG